MKKLSILLSILGCVACFVIQFNEFHHHSDLMRRQKCVSTDHLKLMPYFLETCGECIDATDSSSGTSFADKLSAVVTVLSEQNSVASKNAANVSDCR